MNHLQLFLHFAGTMGKALLQVNSMKLPYLLSFLRESVRTWTQQHSHQLFNTP